MRFKVQLHENICIIPARGGSKRLPGKNTKVFFGQPVISYAIQCAQKTGLFNFIFVSTDCERIAEISRDFGAYVPFMRSAKSSDDHATTLDVLKEVMYEFENREIRFNRVLCMYPVSPLVRPDDLLQGLRKLEETPNALVFPVIEYGHPIWRALSIENGFGRRIWDENTKSRTQDLKSTYHDAGQWYWMSADSITTTDDLSELPIVPIILEESQAQDVDNLSDWKILEFKFQAFKNG